MLPHDGKLLFELSFGLVRPQIGRAVPFDAPHQLYTRKILLEIDAHIGKVLIVLEQDVVVGQVLLDEVAFQGQRLVLAANLNGVKGLHMRDHRQHLGGVGAAVLKVLPHTILERHGLAHIDDRARRIVHQVHAGAVGQQRKLIAQRIIHGRQAANEAADRRSCCTTNRQRWQRRRSKPAAHSRAGSL